LLGEFNDNNLEPRSATPTLCSLLITEGFLHQESIADETTPYRFRLEPLRLWWKRYRPQAMA